MPVMEAGTRIVFEPITHSPMDNGRSALGKGQNNVTGCVCECRILCCTEMYYRYKMYHLEITVNQCTQLLRDNHSALHIVAARKP